MTFAEWLLATGRSPKTARSYTNAIKTCQRYIDAPLADMSADEISAMVATLRQTNTAFRALDDRGKRYYSAGLRRYSEYRREVQ